MNYYRMLIEERMSVMAEIKELENKTQGLAKLVKGNLTMRLKQIEDDIAFYELQNFGAKGD